MKDNAYSRRLFPIFLLALSVRLIYIYQTESSPFSGNLILDALSEDRWGREIAAGDWLGKGRGVFYTDPLYAYTLGVIYSVFGHDLLIVRVIQAVIDSSTCTLLFFVGRAAFGPGAGIVSSIAASVYGPFVYYQGLIQKTTLTIFLLTLFLLAALKAVEAQGKGRWFIAGIFLGLAAMTRGNLLAFAPLVVVYILFCPQNPLTPTLSPKGRGGNGELPLPSEENIPPTNLLSPHEESIPPTNLLSPHGERIKVRGGLLRRCTLASFFLAGLTAALLPLAARNYIYGGAFALAAPSAGINFYIGNNPSAVGVHTPISAVRTIPEKEAEDAARVAEREAGRALTPSEVSRFWLKRGLDFAAAEPGRFLKLIGRKLLLFWNHYEVPDVYNYYFFRQIASILKFFPTFGLIAPLGIAGMLLSFRSRDRGCIPAGLFFVYMATLVVFYVNSRYRLPAALMLLPFGAHALVSLAGLIKARATGRLLAAATATLVAASVVNIDMVDEKGYLSQSHAGLGNIYHRQGRLDEAMTEYRTALNLDPGNPDASNNLAYAYAEKGINLDEALSLVRKALRSNPDSPEFLDTEAYIYFRMGNISEARGAILRAISIDPDDSELLGRLREIDAAATLDYSNLHLTLL